jgi:hypothetical protein
MFIAALAAGGACQCWVCHQPTCLHIIHDAARAIQLGAQTWLESTCQCIYTPTISAYCSLPQVREFLFVADRVMVGPEAEMEYAGQPSIRFCLLNLATGRSLYIFAAAATLLPLDVVME